MGLEYSRDAVAYQQSHVECDLALESARANVAAVVVLYYPQPFLVARLIDTLLPQVNKIFVIDNTPSWDSKGLAALPNATRKVVYRANGYNAGLASAQNSGISAAIDNGHTHVLLLDQDSAIPKGGVDGLLVAERALIQSGREVSAVGPLFLDEKNGHRSHVVWNSGIRVKWRVISAEEKDPIETEYLIASGSLIRTSVLKKVGYMRDELFIDWVDTEWSYRAKGFGLAAYVIPSVVMRHRIGDGTGELLGRRVNLHSPIRNYYIVRNATYLLQKPHMSWKWRVTMITYIPKYILVHSWLSGDRCRSLRQMLQGVRDGLLRKMKPYSTV